MLVTGAGGFVGSAVVRALAAEPGAALRLTARERPVVPPAGAEVVHADVTDPASLAGLCDGVDVLVHLATAVSRDPAVSRAVNVDGTRHLLAEAERAGVRDVVHVSTAAVHGRGPHVDLAESSPAAPVSVASRSRREAEQLVQAAGGVVLRPFYTYGDGDRWFVPMLLRWLRARPRVLVDRGTPRQSVVAVEDLAAVVAAAARRPGAFGGSPFHVCEPEPVRVRDALLSLAALFELPRPRLSLPGRAARGALLACRQHRLERRLELVAVEHTYRSERAWRVAGVAPGARMLDRLDRYADWYRPYALAGGAR
jgi:nucleoside-diphosphate-sugar epimerase